MTVGRVGKNVPFTPSPSSPIQRHRFRVLSRDGRGGSSSLRLSDRWTGVFGSLPRGEWAVDYGNHSRQSLSSGLRRKGGSSRHGLRNYPVFRRPKPARHHTSHPSTPGTPRPALVRVRTLPSLGPTALGAGRRVEQCPPLRRVLQEFHGLSAEKDLQGTLPEPGEPVVDVVKPRLEGLGPDARSLPVARALPAAHPCTRSDAQERPDRRAPSVPEHGRDTVPPPPPTLGRDAGAPLLPPACVKTRPGRERDRKDANCRGRRDHSEARRPSPLRSLVPWDGVPTQIQTRLVSLVRMR